MRSAGALFLSAVHLCLAASITFSAPAPVPPKPKLTKWNVIFELAQLQARKEKKLILAYFSGSDWEDYTQKLEKDVLNTDLFRDYAAKNLVLMKIDFPRDKPLSGNLKSQNDRLKKTYSIIKVPTFILMDNSGLPFARFGYDEAKLRDDEGKDQPLGFLKYLDETIKNRPPDETLIKQKNIPECIAFGKKHFLSSVFLIQKDHTDRVNALRDELVKNQMFVRFINRNVAYCEEDWPYDSDVSPEATAFRNFAAQWKLGPSPMQLVVWDMQTSKVKWKILSVDPSHVDNIIALIENSLPRLDYNGGWIEDYRTAQAIAQQQKRYIFLAFTSMDSSEFSKKMDEEVFQTPEFKKYAGTKLVLVKIDFPTSTTQPTAVAAQNKILAEMFAVRGFPTMVVMNPQGQKIADSKYLKGGAEAFLKDLKPVIKADEDRRALLMGDQQTPAQDAQ